MTGSSYVFCDTPAALQSGIQLLRGLGAALRGDAVASAAIEPKLQQRFRLPGPQGLTCVH